MIKGYIFDYGGTLDTGGCHWGKVLWRAYMRHGVPVTEDRFREAYVYTERALGKGEVIKPGYTFRKTLSIKLSMEMHHLTKNGYWKAGEDEINRKHADILEDIYKDVIEKTAYSRGVLTKIKERCPMVLVSNFYGNINTVLAEFGLDGLFEEVIESAAVGIRKPDPRIFRLGTEALGLDPEDVMVVGDSFTNDIVPAVEAGCRTAWLKGEGWTDTVFDEQLPDIVIKDISRLLSDA